MMGFGPPLSDSLDRKSRLIGTIVPQFNVFVLLVNVRTGARGRWWEWARVEGVATALRLLSSQGVPVVPYSGGSGVAGGAQVRG